MSIHDIATSVSKAVKPHIPTILTIAAGVGVIGTAGSCARDTLKASRILEELEEEAPDAPIAEKAVKVAPAYLPTLLMASATIACIIGVRTTSKAQTAALASAYTIAKETAELYRKKVVETVGEKKAKIIDDAVADQQIKDHPVEKQPVVVGSGEVLCFDTLSSRYFKSDMNTLERVQNELNKKLLDEMWVPLNEFYYRIGLDPMNLGEDLGWNVDDLIRLKFSSRLAENGTPCLVVGYENNPIADFHRRY